MKSISLAVAAVAATFGVSSMATASTITITDTTITVECFDPNPAQCAGFVNGDISLTDGDGYEAGVLSTTAADLYDIGNSSNTEDEAQLVDILIDGIDNDDFVGTDASKTDAGGVDTLGFFSTAEYIVFKIGGGQLDGKHFVIKNTTGDLVSILFDKNNQNGGGISHYTEFGTASEVPLPAAGLLLLGGIGGLTVLRRKKKNA